MQSVRLRICYSMSKTLPLTAGALLSALALMALVTGCANPFPQDLLAKVEKNVTYQAFQDEPGRYDGKLMMFGGEIVETKNVENGAWIVVLQKQLDREGRPNWAAESGGWFLVSTESNLDVGAFRRGRSITVIGIVDGSKPMPLSETEYWYPLLVAQQLHLW
jgi:outer membrane lipoprotein